MRVQQMKRMKQEQAQGMTQEEYEQYQQQQQEAGAAPAPQAPPPPPTYQQTVDERNQAIAQAITRACRRQWHDHYAAVQAVDTIRPNHTAIGPISTMDRTSARAIRYVMSRFLRQRASGCEQDRIKPISAR